MHLARNCEGTEQLRIFYDYDPKVLLTLFSVTKKGPPDLFVVCLATQKAEHRVRTFCFRHIFILHSIFILGCSGSRLPMVLYRKYTFAISYILFLYKL